MRRMGMLAGLLVLSACAQISGMLGNPGPEKLLVHPAEITLTVGDKFRFYATATSAEGEMQRLNVAWSGSDDRLGLVDANGRVTGIAEAGEFTVVATVDDLSATATVRLVPENDRCNRPGTVAGAQISYVQLLQATEVGINGVPAVAGRPVWVRISLLAEQPLLLAEPADVRVHVRSNGTHVGTVSATGSECLLSSPHLSNPGSTYDAEIPAGWLQGPLEIHVTAGDNLRYPASGHLAVDLHRPPELNLVLVPVDLPHVGLEMLLDGDDAASIVELHRAVFPLNVINYSIREPYQYQATDDISSLMGELRTLWLLDGSAAFYQGIVPTGDYEAAAAGFGQLDGPISWGMYFPEPDSRMPRSWTLSHELGHNFGLRHADCGNPAGVVRSPYTGGRTGNYGIMQFSGGLALATPEMSDLMSYCGNKWISDTNYLHVMRNLKGLIEEIEQGVIVRQSLLVHGTISSELVELHPSFVVDVASTAPETGAWLWQLLDQAGAVIAEQPFAPIELSVTAETGLSLFSFTVPVTDRQLNSAGSMHVLRPDGSVAALARQAAGPGLQSVQVLPQARWKGEQTVVTWDPAEYAAVMVFDANGALISRGDSGRIVLNGRFEQLELDASTGLTSHRITLRPD